MDKDADHTPELRSMLAAVVEQVRAMATRMAGDPERPSACHFCGGDVPMWESLLVLQLAGVPAHIQCPESVLDTKLKASGPLEDFPYQEFSEAVDVRMAAQPAEGTDPDYRAGSIEVA